MPRSYTNLIWPSNDRIDEVLHAPMQKNKFRKESIHIHREPSFQYNIS